MKLFLLLTFAALALAFIPKPSEPDSSRFSCHKDGTIYGPNPTFNSLKRNFTLSATLQNITRPFVFQGIDIYEKSDEFIVATGFFKKSDSDKPSESYRPLVFSLKRGQLSTFVEGGGEEHIFTLIGPLSEWHHGRFDVVYLRDERMKGSAVTPVLPGNVAFKCTGEKKDVKTLVLLPPKNNEYEEVDIEIKNVEL